MKALNKGAKVQAIVGFALVLLVLVLGFTGVLAGTVFVKCLIGLGLGYALTRGDFGFAGLSNRACRTGSTKLIRSLMILFVISSIIVGMLLIGGHVASTNLWINPISWGLLIGGILFGIGMAFSSCCATGVLQDVPLGFWRALVTLIFFGIGVFLAFPIMSKAVATGSLFSSATPTANIAAGVGSLREGVWIVDWFTGGDADKLAIGIIGAILVTLVFAGIVIWVSKLYENKVAKNFPAQEKEVVDTKEYTLWERLFVKKWNAGVTILVIAILFGSLYAVTKAGWGASTVYGKWFGTILHRWFGVSLDSLANYTGWSVEKAAKMFNTNLFADAGYMQNIGIILGAFVGLLLSGKFIESFKYGLKIKPLEILLFAVGGILMGVGTRFSLGCNVGALYTPIANFSLAGWLYFFFLFAGGYLGNMLRKAFYVKVDPNKVAKA